MGYAQMGADFAQKLFNQLCLKAKPNENVCISPLSLEIALGMLANGVETEACTEMLDIIAGKDVTPDSLNAWYYKLRSALEATNCVRLANALWTQEGYPINPDFIAVNQTYYDAEVGHLDFTQTQQAADSICQWAYDHTYGNIRQLNIPLSSDTKLVLANATWFGANWASPFEEKSTTKETFTLTDGTTQTVDMMNQSELCNFAERPTYQIIEVPFRPCKKYSSENYFESSFSMLIALPKEGLTPNDIIADIDWDVEEGAHGHLHLPKFNFKTTNGLIPPMEELGIKKLFSTPLNGINPELAIEFINQDVSVKIDEYGAEMAAITTTSASMGLPEYTFDFNANHPFVFAVRDNPSHNILFIGKVENIEEN
jgi:serpin B